MIKFRRVPGWVFSSNLLVVILGLGLHIGTQASGQVAITGDVTPTDPAAWIPNNSFGSSAYVGNTGIGSVLISGETSATSSSAYLGLSATGDGQVTVDNAQWTVRSSLTVGFNGQGLLNINNGGIVNVSSSTSIGAGTTGTGEIHFDNGTLNTGYISAGADQFTGTGTINTLSMLPNWDLVFDANHGMSQTFLLNDLPGQNITVNLTTTASSSLRFGRYGSGSLTVLDGVQLITASSFLGTTANSNATATIDGTGTSWTVAGNLYVGSTGSGTLNVLNGATVTSTMTVSLGADSTQPSQIHLDNGSLNAATLTTTLAQLTGTGTIDAGGLISDQSLQFDASHGMNQTFLLNQSGQNIALQLALTSQSTVGTSGNASLTISEGYALQTQYGYVGYSPDSASTADVTGANSTWRVNTLYVANDGHGTLNVTDGGSLITDSRTYVAMAKTATGQANISGPLSRWTTTDHIYVGYSGTGELNVSNAAKIQLGSQYFENMYLGYSASASGTATITGLGSVITTSRDNIIGYNGHGTLNVLDHGSLSNQDGRIAQMAGSVGVANISGAGATWTTQHNLYIGEAGDGTLNVANAGTVIVKLPSSPAWDLESTYLAYTTDAVGKMNVHDAGSLVDIDQDLYVGYAGTGIVQIDSGSRVENLNGYVGYLPGSHGQVTVSGSGTVWYNSTAYIGYQGDGTLSVLNGANIPNSHFIAYNADSTGQVIVDGTGSKFGVYSVGVRGNGSLVVQNGGWASSFTASIGSLAGSNGVVTIDGPNSKWTITDLVNQNGTFRVGDEGNATLNIINGGTVTVNGNYNYVADEATSVAVINVDGADSLWSITGELFFGSGGQATLNIANGGKVVSADDFSLPRAIGAENASIHFDNGSLHAKKFTALTSQLSGSGTIYATNLACDLDVVFDANTGPNIGIAHLNQSPGQNITLYMDQTNESYLYVGPRGPDSITIRDGGSFSSRYTYLEPGALLAVQGSDSHFATRSLYIGKSGSARMNITQGAQVLADTSAYIGWSGHSYSGDSFLNIDGDNSQFTVTYDLTVGDTTYSRTGYLNVTNNAHAQLNRDLIITPLSTVTVGISSPAAAISVSRNITNNGVIRLFSDPSLAAGTYTPITLGGTWSGTGQVQAFGGTWNPAAHTFNLSNPTTLAPDQTISLNLADAPRLIITDPTTSQQVLVSFPQSSGSYDFAAAPVTPDNLAGLILALADSDTILSDWSFQTTFPHGQPVMLSLFVGDSAAFDSLTVWHLDDLGEWSVFPNANPILSQGWLTFLVDGFSGYAVSESHVIPEPTPLAILACICPLLARRKLRLINSH